MSGPWTKPQVRGLILVVTIVAVVLVVRLARSPHFVADPQPEQGDLAWQLQDRIDPNTASAAQLQAIPSLGAKRAEGIVAFRERARQRHPNAVVFSRPSDLEQVRGVGLATAETMSAYLMFPKPATRP